MTKKVYTGNWQENNFDSSKPYWDSEHAKRFRIQSIEPYSIAGEVIDKSYWNNGSELLYTCQKNPMLSDYLNFPERKRTKSNDLLLTRNATPYIFIPKINSIYSNVVQKITIVDNVDKRFVKYVLKEGDIVKATHRILEVPVGDALIGRVINPLGMPLDDLGVIVKVNSVLIPGLNDQHIEEIAKEVSKRGASLMNVLPLIPLNKMENYERPDCLLIENTREKVEEYLPVFRACTQCRADAYGIPGKKSHDHNLGVTPSSHF